MMVVSGLEELNNKFKQLDAKLARSIAFKMVVAGGRIVRNEAKSIAQSKGLKRTGTLLKNIALKRERTQRGVVQYNVGVRHGKNLTKKAMSKLDRKRSKTANGGVIYRYTNDPFYFRFLEFGTKYMSARSFLAPALANKKDEALRVMGAVFEKETMR